MRQVLSMGIVISGLIVLPASAQAVAVIAYGDLSPSAGKADCMVGCLENERDSDSLRSHDTVPMELPVYRYDGLEQQPCSSVDRPCQESKRSGV